MANQEKLEAAVYQLLEALGEDPKREGLLDTPKRVAKMYQEMFSGLNEDPKDQFYSCVYRNHDEAVLVKDIRFTQCVSTTWFLLWKSSCCLFAKLLVA